MLCVAVGGVGEPDGGVRKMVSVGAVGRVLGRGGQDDYVVDRIEGATWEWGWTVSRDLREGEKASSPWKLLKMGRAA